MTRLDTLHNNLLHNPFHLLALLLSPWKDQSVMFDLHALLSAEKINWGSLLHMANLHLCTPLLYARLSDEGLLSELPENLQEYLRNLYALNVDRNQKIAEEAAALLAALHQCGIEALMLKGMASLCDNLYGHLGARVMMDMDILVESSSLAKVQDTFSRLGYHELAAPGRILDGLPTDERHHHLPMYYKPDSPAGVEIHFKIAYGQAGRALTAKDGWQHKTPALLEGQSTYLLNPTHRLLHNAVHALVPHAEFIRSEISLLQLAEFATLAHNYQTDLDWQAWLRQGSKAGLELQLLAYIEAAHRLMMMPWPFKKKKALRVNLHALRFLVAGEYLPEHQLIKHSIDQQIIRHLLLVCLRIYYYINLLGWAWRNVCYAEGVKNLPARLQCLSRKIFQNFLRGKAAE